MEYQINYYNTQSDIYKRRSLRLDTFIDVKTGLSYQGFQYTSYRRFTNDFKRILKKHNVSIMNITKMVKLFQEDLSSFDLKLNIIGHDKGMYDLISINEVEELALSKNDLESLSNNNYLYEYEFKDSIIVDTKKFLKKELLKRKKNKEAIKKLVNTFCRRNLKPFIMNMNNKFDAQYVITENGIEPEETTLSKESLNQIYVFMKKMIARYADDILFSAYWKTINQKVLERYK